MVETNDQWITERTGIKERHILEKGQGTSDMAAEAARRCLAARGIAATEVEAIVVERAAERARKALHEGTMSRELEGDLSRVDPYALAERILNGHSREPTSQ